MNADTCQTTYIWKHIHVELPACKCAYMSNCQHLKAHTYPYMCTRITCIYTIQCLAVSCSVLQCLAVSCSVLQCLAVSWSVLQCLAASCSVLQRLAVCCSVLQCLAVSCSVWQCLAVSCSVWQCLAVSCIRLCLCATIICVAVCYSVLQCVVICRSWLCARYCKTLQDTTPHCNTPYSEHTDRVDAIHYIRST